MAQGSDLGLIHGGRARPSRCRTNQPTDGGGETDAEDAPSTDPPGVILRSGVHHLSPARSRRYGVLDTGRKCPPRPGTPLPPYLPPLPRTHIGALLGAFLAKLLSGGASDPIITPRAPAAGSGHPPAPSRAAPRPLQDYIKNVSEWVQFMGFPQLITMLIKQAFLVSFTIRALLARHAGTRAMVGEQ